MIPARRVSDPLETALERLAVLAEVKRREPDLQIYAFGVIVRVAHDNDPHEEKPYYGQWGRELRAYSAAFDRHARHGDAEAGALDAARAALPPEVLADWLGTRERNRALHLAALDLLASGVLTHLCLTLDDTTPYGWPPLTAGCWRRGPINWESGRGWTSTPVRTRCPARCWRGRWPHRRRGSGCATAVWAARGPS